MEAVAGSPSLPPPIIDPLTEKIKDRLLKKGVEPTPKIIHTLRKKHVQKSLRKSKRLEASQPQPVSKSQEQTLAEEFYFKTISREYKQLNKILDTERGSSGDKMVGRPWERLDRWKLRELAPGSDEFKGEKLNSQYLRELGEIFEERKKEAFSLMLDNDDVELEDSLTASNDYVHVKRRRADTETIQFLVDRLCAWRGTSVKDWKFSRMMKQVNLQYTEVQLLKIVGVLGDRGSWKQAMCVVEWVYSRREHKYNKSRFVYTKLLAVLGNTRRPQEALHGDCNIYPDMAAYHSISVTLGQAGLLKELMNIVELMKQKPSRGVKNVHNKRWDPVLQPDLVVLNACVPSHQWKGVSWVFQQLRKYGIRPKGATYGLAMEVMLHSGKYELVHELFGRLKRSTEVPNALTYKVLVKTFWKEDKVDRAIDVVREMEQRGIVRTASVYYELACSLCNKGRWPEAIEQIKKLKKLSHPKPLEVAFTGMILSSMDGGHVNDCILIFEHMTRCCKPNIGAINAMLEVYGRNDMFAEAKALFEKTERTESGYGASSNNTDNPLLPDIHTYTSMLKASAHAQQWEYFECVYKEMILQGYQLDQITNCCSFFFLQGHLLENAFEAILEAGEIPNSLLFTEMVCVALELGYYERAQTIANTMAYAPFQMSVNKWSDLFEKNKGRISMERLKTFLMVLRNNDMAKEATMSNLLGSLQSLCKSSSTKEIPANTSLSSVLISNSSKSFNAENPYVSEVIGFHETNLPSKNLRFNAELQPEYGDSNTCSSNIFRMDNMVPDESGDFSDVEEHILEMVESLDIPVSKVDDFQGPDLPSADEILKAWKESSERDGFVSSFSRTQLLYYILEWRYRFRHPNSTTLPELGIFYRAYVDKFISLSGLMFVPYLQNMV
ncbi:hypothetical protein V2J09_021596 [Rumex salicifolius]